MAAAWEKLGLENLGPENLSVECGAGDESSDADSLLIQTRNSGD